MTNPVMETPWVQRLYVVVNGELPFGYQTAQSIHAVTEFSRADFGNYHKWMDEGNYIVVLQVEDIHALVTRRAMLESEGHKTFAFHEPDLGDQMTAFAVLPDPNVQELLSDLSLVGSEPKHGWNRIFRR